LQQRRVEYAAYAEAVRVCAERKISAVGLIAVAAAARKFTVLVTCRN
jgi:hypothetical protein